ncbi:MAG: hypothetical protein H6822_19210 [Planctomycetaceae bacterium]|nr:hypothetical protein [Planctomycetales bacterium]MCB9924315.1 hypothetical protein [Planctomycetaceae bacterium]
MVSSPKVSPRAQIEAAVLHGHLWKYRVSTLALLAEAYFSEGKRPRELARKVVSPLIAQGLLAELRLVIRPVPQLSKPTFVWSSGRAAPNANALSYLLEKRFGKPSVQTTVFFATRAAVRRFGGRGGQIKRSHQVSHDLACTAVYLRLEQTRPEVARDWKNEDFYAGTLKRGEKLGDALLIGPDGPYRLIEVLGRYTAKHIQALHDFSAAKELPYELW